MEVKLHSHEKVNLLNFDRQGLEAYFSEIGEKPFRAAQLLKWIYQFGVDDFNAMSNFSKSLREKLTEVAEKLTDSAFNSCNTSATCLCPVGA